MHERLSTFIRCVEDNIEKAVETEMLTIAKSAMRELVSVDDWLPEDCARPHEQHYQQYLLYRCPKGRFSVVSFVWGPGQKTPVHDHTVWGVIGILRGAEDACDYEVKRDRLVQRRPSVRMNPGDVEIVSPTLGDIHRVSNALPDRVSISIHCYGADIGKVQRHVFDLKTGASKTFISGYANA